MGHSRSFRRLEKMHKSSNFQEIWLFQPRSTLVTYPLDLRLNPLEEGEVDVEHGT